MGEEDFSSRPPGAGNALTGRMSRALQGGGLWPSVGGGVGLPEARELLKKNSCFSESGPDCCRYLTASLTFPHCSTWSGSLSSLEMVSSEVVVHEGIIPVPPSLTPPHLRSFPLQRQQ